MYYAKDKNTGPWILNPDAGEVSLSLIWNFCLPLAAVS
jgi:hypothetical protein